MSRARRVGIDLPDGLVRRAVLHVLGPAEVELVVGPAPGALVVHADPGRGDRRHLLVVAPRPRACREAREALVAGRAGAVVTTDGLDDLPPALVALAAGAAWIPHRVLATAAEAPAPTDRQVALLHALRAGASTRTIAQRLGVSATTVKRELAALRDAFDATSRTEVVVAAVEAGWVGSPGGEHRALEPAALAGAG